MKKTTLFLILFSAILVHAEEYTIVFNSSTSDSSTPTSEFGSIVSVSTDNCANRVIYADKVYRAKEDFGIKLGTSSVGGKLTIGLNTKYNIQSMTIYAAAYGGNNKDSVNAVCICGDTISWHKGHATVISAYTIKAPGLTDSLTLASTKASKNRFYIQKIVFTAEDPFPNVAKITLPPVIDLGSAIITDGQLETDAINVSVTTRSTAKDSLVLKLAGGTTFTLMPTQLPYYGGEINISYTISQASDRGYPINDSLIVTARGLDNNMVRKAVPVTVFAKNYTAPVLPVDSSCMRIGPMPGNYYQPAQGLKDEELMNALSEIIHCGPHYKYGSGRLHTWNGFFFTDRDTITQQVYDMYSNNKRYFNIEDTCASVSEFDIEHMLPKKWWNSEENGATTDLFHLVPADFSANRSKQDNAPGIPSDSTFNNGSFVTGDGSKYGHKRVWCPADEYKGDFARAYFYIVTCYKELVWLTTGIAGKSMTNDSYLEFLPWLQDLLMSWHRMDPVSPRELERAVEVNKIQGNRNPFIDYPELAEYIWGNKQGEVVNFYNLTQSYGDPYDETSTDISATPLDTDETVSKIMIDDQVYIVKDGEYYTIQGQ